MRFHFIEQAKKDFPAYRLCRLMGVSQSGYFAWRDRSASHRQRGDLVMLAHVRSAYSLPNETYGSPRMTRELQDQGGGVGRRRIARLMRENGMHAHQNRRFKRPRTVITLFPSRRISSHRILQQQVPNRSGGPIYPISGHGKDGFTSLLSSTSSHVVLSAGLSATGYTASWRCKPSKWPSPCDDRQEG